MRKICRVEHLEYANEIETFCPKRISLEFQYRKEPEKNEKRSRKEKKKKQKRTRYFLFAHKYLNMQITLVLGSKEMILVPSPIAEGRKEGP